VQPFSDRSDEVMRFRDSLDRETDRGVALVCAAYLDEELKNLLEKTLVDEPKVVERLLGQSGPLGDFSSKIDLAFGMGIIKAESHWGLHIVRKIRNDFAHVQAMRSFADAGTAERCRELIKLNPYADEKDPRKIFTRACMSILAELHAKVEQAEHQEVSKGPTIESLRSVLENARGMFEKIFASGDKEQLADPLKALAEQKRLLREALIQAGFLDEGG
jgi:DNA-binding MltR family transcriptional regulator